MKWIDEYQLFLFDFDGLLVNTEEIHYLAYKKMCHQRGFELLWDFPYYCSIAHYSSDGLRQQIYADFPQLEAQQPNWEVLYAEKKQAFLHLLRNGSVHMMPGAEALLQLLAQKNKKRCIVTHSAHELVKTIRSQQPILNTIPHWITRENYSRPKPDSECYLTAIQKLADPHEKVIGFEDSPRGLTALLGTRAKSVLVSSIPYPEISQFVEQGASYFKKLDAINL